MNKELNRKLCSCIKKVRNTVKKNKKKTKKTKEQSAIAICVKSVLQSRGKRLYKFRCKKKPFLKLQ